MQKRYEIDPVTGLRLEVLEPLPSPQAAIMTNLGIADTGTIPPPAEPAIVQPFDPADPDVGVAGPSGATAASGTRANTPATGKRSFLDNLIHAIAGKPDADLRLAGNQKELSERNQRRKAAAALSKSAAEAPGEEFMGIPSPGSGEGSQQLTQMIGGAAKLIGGLFK